MLDDSNRLGLLLVVGHVRPLLQASEVQETETGSFLFTERRHWTAAVVLTAFGCGNEVHSFSRFSTFFACHTVHSIF